MQQKLEKLNQWCESLETNSKKLLEDMHHLNQKEYSAAYTQWIEIQRKIEIISQNFLAVASDNSPEEIVEAYRGSCTALKRAIGGYMIFSYNSLYSETMIEAIKSSDEVGYLFLAKISEELGDTANQIVIDALNSTSRRIRETALGITRQRSIVEAIPQLQVLMSYQGKDEADEIKEVLNSLLTSPR